MERPAPCPAPPMPRCFFRLFSCLLILEVLRLSPVGRFLLRPLTFDFQTFDPLPPSFQLSAFNFQLLPIRPAPGSEKPIANPFIYCLP